MYLGVVRLPLTFRVFMAKISDLADKIHRTQQLQPLHAVKQQADLLTRMHSSRRLGRRLNVSWLFLARSLFGSEVWMGSPPACAKCKRGGAAEGDSWCSGCIALEGCTTALKGFWWSASHRRLAESILVQAGQQLRAVKNLDTTLQSFNDSWESRLRKAGQGAVRPPEPAHPPRQVGGPESAAEKRPRSEEEVKEEPRGGSPPGSHPTAGSPRGISADYGDPSESWSEDPRGEPEGEVPPPGVYPKSGGARAPEGHPVDRRARSRDGGRRRPRGPRPGHRGGTRHQRRFREHQNPGQHRFHQRSSVHQENPRQRRDRVLESDIWEW